MNCNLRNKNRFLIDLCSKKTAFNQLDASRFFFHTNFSIAWGLNPRLLKIDGYLPCHPEPCEGTPPTLNACDPLADNAL
jgi:hypothetical protein